MPIEREILGKWNLVYSDNFDAYMKEIGVSYLTRKIGVKVKPTNEFAVSGDNWTVNSVSTFKTHTMSFKLGDECDTTTIDGRKVLSKFTVEDDKLVQTEVPANGGCTSRIVRSIVDGKLVVDLSCGMAKARRVYEKV